MLWRVQSTEVAVCVVAETMMRENVFSRCRLLVDSFVWITVTVSLHCSTLSTEFHLSFLCLHWLVISRISAQLGMNQLQFGSCLCCYNCVASGFIKVFIYISPQSASCHRLSASLLLVDTNISQRQGEVKRYACTAVHHIVHFHYISSTNQNTFIAENTAVIAR